MEKPKKRYGSLAGLLSLLAPGLGLLYAGKWRWAVGAPLLLFLGFFLAGWTRLILLPNMVLMLAAVLVVGQLAIAIASFIVARRRSRQVLNNAQRWYFYVAFAVSHFALSVFVAENRATLVGFEPFRFPSMSMSDTLLAGDYLLADTWAYRSVDPARGDVIVFRYPEDPSQKWAKRVVGLPGDRVEMRNGVLHINGKPVEEPYVRASNNLLTASRDFEVVVPGEAFFVLGDNRDNSRDSRYWGFVPRSLVHGKVRNVWLSLDRDYKLRVERFGLSL